jgi:TPR repeat protein
MKKYLIVVILVIITLGNSIAQVSQSNWQKIVAEMQAKSDAGDPRAMGIMASLLRTGDGGNQDLIKAENLAKKSDSLGSPFGTYEIGVLREKTNKGDAEISYKKAYPELLKLAENGDYFAQSIIASMYYFGMGVEKNSQSGFEWYQKSADQGFASAQTTISKLFLAGEVCVKDHKRPVISPTASIGYFCEACKI